MGPDESQGISGERHTGPLRGHGEPQGPGELGPPGRRALQHHGQRPGGFEASLGPSLGGAAAPTTPPPRPPPAKSRRQDFTGKEGREGPLCPQPSVLRSRLMSLGPGLAVLPDSFPGERGEYDLENRNVKRRLERPPQDSRRSPPCAQKRARGISEVLLKAPRRPLPADAGDRAPGPVVGT